MPENRLTPDLHHGFGTRLAEESGVKPKPMVEIGGKPILWHIMKIYAHYGVDEFIICCGYKGHMIKEYFAHYFLHTADIAFDLKNNRMDILRNHAEPWSVTLVDTGIETMTGGRLARVREYIGDETFCMTYGDGVGNVDIGALMAWHREQGTEATLTAVQPLGRFGSFELDPGEERIKVFREKEKEKGSWINAGFFVLEPSVLDLIESDATTWEREPLETLADRHQLSAFRHTGFWQPMDTLRDKNFLEDQWAEGNPPWKVWS
ncbi:MAG: glucose-1-phosphate cytidylyltransferase [Verrucomicrobiota bacterium]